MPEVLANLSRKLFCWLKIAVSVCDDTVDLGMFSMDNTVVQVLLPFWSPPDINNVFPLDSFSPFGMLLGRFSYIYRIKICG